jgi:hypothetical protein
MSEGIYGTLSISTAFILENIQSAETLAATGSKTGWKKLSSGKLWTKGIWKISCFRF